MINGCVKTVSSKILIVEDEIIIALDLKIRLENLGHNVTDTVFNGVDAIKKAGETYPDVVLMDILLNGKMNGIEVAKKIKNLYNIPHIYLTGSSNNTILGKAQQTEPAGYITKPFDDAEIQNAIDKAIKNNITDI